MTTGRINQVTIVRWGDQPTARVSGQSRYLVTGTGAEARGVALLARREPGLPRTPSAFPFLISQSSVGRSDRAPRRLTHRLRAPRGGPARRVCANAHQLAGTPGGYIVGLASCQTPTEPNLRR